MYAIVKTGGKQIKVSQGNKLRVERLEGETGTDVNLENVLLLGDDDNVTVGTPYIEGASVTAKIVEQIRDRKVRVFKKKRRQGYRNTKGHRQHLTVLEITGVNAPSGKKAAASTTGTKATKSAESKPAAKKATTTKETSAKETLAKETLAKAQTTKTTAKTAAKTTAKKPAAKSATSQTAAKKPAAKKTAAKKTAESETDKK